ncbi:monovalent cation:H+ antiporter, CPA1 (nhx1) [Ascosphaera aggregata]|nr:monovalent cation:H+ antiporter, CPA1 (nhx1) [Ascosphaera aggregata]
MLFWAGLRGAVGVALAAGLEGENAPALRATVLVVVVLTVIIFGGTTARMLEILDIRTGVVEEVDSDDEFDIEVAPGGTYYKYDGRGIGYYPSGGPNIVSSEDAPHDTTIPLDDVGGDLGAMPKSGRVSRTSMGSGGLAARKPSMPPSKFDRALSSGSSSSLSPSTSNEIEDYELDVDFDYDDDDLPPPAARGARSRNDAAAAAPLLGSGTLPAGLQPPITATPASGPSRSILTAGPSTPSYTDSAAAAGPSRDGSRTPMEGRLFTRERLTQARTAVSHLFSGTGEGDHTAWFKQLDEDYIKPRLLLDGAEAGRKPPRGPGAVVLLFTIIDDHPLAQRYKARKCPSWSNSTYLTVLHRRPCGYAADAAILLLLGHRLHWKTGDLVESSLPAFSEIHNQRHMEFRRGGKSTEIDFTANGSFKIQLALTLVEAFETIENTQKADWRDDIFIMSAHDESALGVVEVANTLGEATMSMDNIFPRSPSRSSDSSDEYPSPYDRKLSVPQVIVPEPEYRHLRRLCSEMSLNEPTKKSNPVRKDSVTSLLSREVSRLNEVAELQNRQNEEFRKELVALIRPHARLPDIEKYDGNPETFDQFQVNLLCKIRLDQRAIGSEEEWILYGYSRLEQGPAQEMNEWILARLLGKQQFVWDEFLVELRRSFRYNPKTMDMNANLHVLSKQGFGRMAQLHDEASAPIGQSHANTASYLAKDRPQPMWLRVPVPRFKAPSFICQRMISRQRLADHLTERNLEAMLGGLFSSEGTTSS